MGWFGKNDPIHESYGANNVPTDGAESEAARRQRLQIQAIVREELHAELQRRDRQARADAALVWFEAQGFVFRWSGAPHFDVFPPFKCQVAKGAVVLGEGSDDEERPKAILRAREQVERALKAAEALCPK